MNTKITVHRGYYPLDIEKVAEKYAAVYMGDFSVRDKYGNWSEQPVAIFYVENPDTSKGHSHYFGIFKRYNDINDLKNFSLVITRGDSAFSEPLDGIIADNGEVLVSGFSHDYKESEDGSVMIDGGRSGYIRYSGSQDKLVKIVVNKDKFEIL